MKNKERLDLLTRLVKDEGEKRYVYSQSMFNFQYSLLVKTVASNGALLESRHDWRYR